MPTTSLERENLEAHVDLCAERYDAMDKRIERMENQLEKFEKRFDSIDEKIDGIKDAVALQNAMMTKALIGAAGTIVVAVISTITVFTTM